MARGKLGACVGQGHLTTAAREFARYKLDLMGYRRLGGTKGEQYEQGV